MCLHVNNKIEHIKLFELTKKKWDNYSESYKVQVLFGTKEFYTCTSLKKKKAGLVALCRNVHYDKTLITELGIQILNPKDSDQGVTFGFMFTNNNEETFDVDCGE